MIYLEDKIALLIQLPPSMGMVEGMNGLRDIIPELDKIFRYAVEIVRSFKTWHIVFFQITICAWSEVKCWTSIGQLMNDKLETISVSSPGQVAFKR